MNQRFEIGEEVLCIESTILISTTPLVIKGKKYTIKHVEYCPSCGNQSVNVGVQTPIPEHIHSGKCKCNNCGNLFKVIQKSIVASNRFVRVQDIDNQLEIAVENENYELAQVLHDSKLSN